MSDEKQKKDRPTADLNIAGTNVPARGKWLDVTTGQVEPSRQVDYAQQKPYLLVLAGSRIGEMVPITGQLTVGRSEEAMFRVVGSGISKLHLRLMDRHDGSVEINVSLVFEAQPRRKVKGIFSVWFTLPSSSATTVIKIDRPRGFRLVKRPMPYAQYHPKANTAVMVSRVYPGMTAPASSPPTVKKKPLGRSFVLIGRFTGEAKARFKVHIRVKEVGFGQVGVALASEGGMARELAIYRHFHVDVDKYGGTWSRHQGGRGCR